MLSNRFFQFFVKTYMYKENDQKAKTTDSACWFVLDRLGILWLAILAETVTHP